MSIVSRTVKGGESFSQYGCSARHNKGAVCGNKLTVSEKRINESVLDALRRYFGSPDFQTYLEESYRTNEQAREAAARREDEATRLQAEIKAAEARIEKVTEAIARIGYSAPLERKLKGEESKLLDARKALALLASPATPKPFPPKYSARAVLAVLDALGAASKAKPQKAKAMVRAFVAGILMKPKADGYTVTLDLKHQPCRPCSSGGQG